MIPVATLVRPATTRDAVIGMNFPSSPGTSFTVTLDAIPAGRVSLSSTSFSLSNGQTKTFTVTPLSVSQEVGDVVIRAHVSGVTTGVAEMTNVGVVLPSQVRGGNTPDGMTDRVSVGGGNWGSFTGVARVAPALAGIHDVTLSVSRPTADNKYGNATVPAADATRASLVGRSIVNVTGTVQTAASLDVNGKPDWLAQHANQLRLQAGIAGNPQAVFVAA